MKYKLYEKLSDFFRLRLFTKTNIAILALLSIALNIAMGTVAYNEHKEFQALSAVYAGQVSEETTTTPAKETTEEKSSAKTETTESQPQSEESTKEQTTQADISETKADETTAVQSEQGTYYVTDSGTKYHIGSCGYLKKSRNPISLSEAKARGFTPCSRCIK
ncbi:MAG: hypothetical protein IJW86_06140 [Clostridia bacterium]|nr:hypothetical protein [Clostridia bacterium]